MGSHYGHMSVAERNFFHTSLNAGLSLGVISASMGRARSTLSREVLRNAGTRECYDAGLAGQAARARVRCGQVKLGEGTALRRHVFDHIKQAAQSESFVARSPQQISGGLRAMDDSDLIGPKLPHVSHETIYRAIYILPRGEIRKELVGLLRQRKSLRGARPKGKEKRGGLIDMISIRERPDISGRELPGDWEGDLIKGAGNASAIGTLIERKSRLTILVKMKDCSSRAALAGFSRELGKVPQAMRKSLAYDQGKEMALHNDLAKALKLKVYFCDPHSPWQRPSNENMNGLVRQYLPKGFDLSLYLQRDLDPATKHLLCAEIAESLNTRPRAVLGFRTPLAVFAQECAKLEAAA